MPTDASCSTPSSLRNTQMCVWFVGRELQLIKNSAKNILKKHVAYHAAHDEGAERTYVFSCVVVHVVKHQLHFYSSPKVLCNILGYCVLRQAMCRKVAFSFIRSCCCVLIMYRKIRIVVANAARHVSTDVRSFFAENPLHVCNHAP